VSGRPPGAQLIVEDAATVVAFCTQVFDAVPVQCECLLDGQILQAELDVDGYRLTISEWPEGPLEPDDSVVALRLFSLNARTLVERALAAHATLASTVAGDAPAAVVFQDPSGHRWAVTTAHDDDATR
jgi:PhnB protein